MITVEMTERQHEMIRLILMLDEVIEIVDEDGLTSTKMKCQFGNTDLNDLMRLFKIGPE